MTNKDFLRSNPLEFVFPTKKRDEVIKLLTKAQESYTVVYSYESDGEMDHFKVMCDRTNFAFCLFNLGRLFEQSQIFFKK